MTDPSYSDDKRANRCIDLLYAVTDSDYGIPRRCPCGGQIVIQICNEETEMLKKKVEGHERRIQRLNSMENRIKILEEDEKNNAAEIDEIKYFLKNRYPNNFY
ncbi:hypothetical protein YC2023_041666 [Brassica napus]